MSTLCGGSAIVVKMGAWCIKLHKPGSLPTGSNPDFRQRQPEVPQTNAGGNDK